ncbi:MAG: hypothetical protein IJU23_13860, partial [Proteobacteria bacterium]|nr:hypothetical protein [Pseudomonadota bacterium]
CGGGEGSVSSICPESCPDGQHCDETTGYVCIDDIVEPEKKCPDTCPDKQHCDASTDYKCVDDAGQKCPESCPDNQHCDASTDYKCVDDVDPGKKCPESCPDNQHCDASTDYQCVDDVTGACPETCPENEHCDASTEYKCASYCAEVCEEGEHCDIASGKCVDDIPECPAECPENEHCSVEIGLCVPDDKPCETECEDGWYCDTSKGVCVESEQKLCAEECKEGFECKDGTCVEIAVVKECQNPGEVVCSGDLLMVCNEEGAYELKQDCSEASEACFADADGNIGCHESECATDSSACKDGSVMKCNAFHKYEAVQNCAELEETPICDDSTGSGQCIAKCELGASRCTIDGKVESCKESGFFEVDMACDPEKSVCKVDEGGGASCVDFDCTGDAQSCDGNVLQKCDNGFLVVLNNCEEHGMICRTQNNTSSCVESICADGDKRCNGFKIEVCKDNAFVASENCLEHNAFCMLDKGEPVCKVPDVVEDTTDTDEDTIPDYLECSAGTPETGEGCEDTDKDGTPDYRDLDSDGDGIPDKIEANNNNGEYEPDDADYDGIPNYLDPDSDGNGVPDSIECCGGDTKCLSAKEKGMFTYCIDTDTDDIPDYLDFDNDNDNALDVDEITGMVINPPTPETGKFSGYGCKNGNAFGTAEKPVDCDADTIPDYMDFDSDNDGFCDDMEGVLRMNIMVNGVKRGSYSRYNADTDSDGISDAVEAAGVLNVSKLGAKNKYGCYTINKVRDSDGDGIMDLLEIDSDNDGLKDSVENNIVCSNGLVPRIKADTDGDGYLDPSEYAVAQSAGSGYTVSQMVCDSKIGVKDVYDFYFELPNNAKDDDVLTFSPKVSKLDLVFNVDTTGSMSGTINTVKTNINSMITSIRSMVTDSGFTLTMFDDFPVSGYGGGTDRPLVVAGPVSTVASTVSGYMNNSHFTASGGADGAESGAESLYQIATGKGVAWSGGSLPAHANPTGTWGYVDFRSNTLPVVVHATDIYSHDSTASNALYNTTNASSLAYSSSYVPNPHYTVDLIPVLKSTGMRVIGLGTNSSADSYKQMTAWARESNAVVPVCAFKTGKTSWSCGENKCCLGTSATSPVTVNGVANQCILTYTGTASNVNNYIVQGVDALVKYGTYNVTTKIRGNVMDNNKNTSCFIDKIVAKQYLAPANEPEASCNPVAKPTKFSSSYEDGFTNFATGTSTAGVTGARLTFTVYAKNDGCYPQGDEAKVFTAYIDVFNPTTGLLFDTQLVSIIVPAKEADSGGEISG